MTPNLVGIVCALQSEARHLGSATRRSESLQELADGTLLCVSGMGGQAAARGAQQLVDAGAAALVSWGMAGGLDPSLIAGALLLPHAVIGANGQAIETSRPWRERLSAAIASRLTPVPGKLATAGQAVASIAEKAALFRETGAAAVDMESLAIAQVAMACRVPFLAVRVIVDTAADELPGAVKKAANAEGHLSIWHLLGALALAPADLPALLRLARRYQSAARSLAAVASAASLGLSAFPRLEHSSPAATS